MPPVRLLLAALLTYSLATYFWMRWVDLMAPPEVSR